MPITGGQGIGAASGCALLEGATAYVGFDSCKEPYTNYFLCDGTADNVQINAAIVYVGALGGGVIHIEACPAGITYYDITAPIVDGGYDNITLESVGEAGVLRVANATAINCIHLTAVSGWEIRYLYINGNAANQVDDGNIETQNGIYLAGVCSEITITDITVADTEWNGILVGYTDTLYGGCNNIIIEKCKLFDCGKDVGVNKDGIRCYGADTVIVADNIIRMSQSHGIIFYGSQNLTIDGNISSECVRAGSGDGICLYYCTQSSITGNTCDNNAHHGIVLATVIGEHALQAGPCTWIDIVGNNVEGVSARAIGNSGADVANVYLHINVVGNTIREGASNIGFDYTNDLLIVSNDCYSASAQGIYADSCIRATLAFNEIDDPGSQGIYSRCTDAVVSGNIVYAATVGIEIRSFVAGDKAGVTGNLCSGCSSHGFSIRSESSGTFTGNTARGNTGNGIYVTSQGARKWVVTGNLCEANGGSGLYLDANVDYSVFTGNSFNGNTGPGITIAAATCSGNIVKDNDLSGNSIPISDAGTDTVYDAIVGEFPLSNVGGGAAAVAPVINTSPGGIDIDANDEFTHVKTPLPVETQQVVRIKIWAYSNVIEATNNMLLRIVAHGATGSELWSGNPIDVVNKPSVEEGGIVATDVIHWVITVADDAQLGTLAAQDYVELMAVGEAASAPDIATDALFGGYEIEYV